MKKLYMLTLGAMGMLVIPAKAQVTSENYAVEVSAVVNATGPSIKLIWPSDPAASSFTIYRKAKDAVGWGASVATIKTDTTYTDNNVKVGIPYEYEIVKKVTDNSLTGYGYIFSGINLPAVDYRGKTLLIYPVALKDSIYPEISRLKQDMIGDGWQVIEMPLPANTTVANLRQMIDATYKKDPKNTKSIFLLGHVPVLYSGDAALDGHTDHIGAWPADMVYGDVDGVYTDQFINDAGASRPENQNVPDDGKYDQDVLTSAMEMQVGRVDMHDLPAFSLSEVKLLKQYLNKDHAWRMAQVNIPERGLVQDNFGVMSGEAFAASGYKSFAPMFGKNNVVTLPYYKTMKTAGYLWSYGTGGGDYNSSDGIIKTSQFATDSIQTVFTMLFGSYFGDWDSENDLLRAALANKGPILTDAWSGRPHWYFHHMAMGETVGYDARISQTDYTSYWKSIYLDTGSRVLSAALMGDPNLRLQMVSPPTSPILTQQGNLAIKMDWIASTDKDVIGYNVYRAPSLDSMFVKLNTALITGTSFTDSKPVQGHVEYMVRAEKLQKSASGTYYNMSTGALDSIYFKLSDIVQPNQPFVSLYPNPTTGMLKLSVSATMYNAQMMIMDVTGKVVYNEPFAQILKGQNYTLNLTNLNKGAYFIELRSNDNLMRTQFIKE